MVMMLLEIEFLVGEQKFLVSGKRDTTAMHRQDGFKSAVNTGLCQTSLHKNSISIEIVVRQLWERHFTAPRD